MERRKVEKIENWFSRLGLAVSDTDRLDSLAYVKALGLVRGLEVQVVAKGEQVQNELQTDGWDLKIWELEDDLRQSLTSEAISIFGKKRVFDFLTSEMECYTDISFRKAMATPKIAAVGEAFARVASGALLMALHCQILANLCKKTEEHLFVRKYRLFSNGRWPLGIRGNIIHLF